MFVDETRILVSSGKGGDGAVSFHREKYRPNGGPDGGDGGRGGAVVLVAEGGLATLSTLKDHPHQRAGPGVKGARNNKKGADAQDLVVPVPVGTTVTDEKGERLADLASPGDRVVIAKGGRGGRGNASFKTHARRAPGFGELGEPGEELWIGLEMRLIADVAVIGFPNAGKSTLVSALSAAKPKVAGYPFTTLEPTLGIVDAGEFAAQSQDFSAEEKRFAVCDIPGLIEGAHAGKGLGLKFLRHAERAPVFIHLIDLASGRDPLGDFKVVNEELQRFRTDLASRSQVVALNKVDEAGQESADETKLRLSREGVEAVIISAAQKVGLDHLVAATWELVSRTRAERPQAAGFELFRTPPDRVTAFREQDAWRVEGGAVRRWVAMTDMGNPEAVAYLQKRLERAGVEEALAEAGADHGDEVRLGPVSFEWWPTGSDPDAKQGPDGAGVRGGRTRSGRTR